MERGELLRALRGALERAHGRRLAGLVLYGSEARGESAPDSDIDVLVLLAGPVEYLQDLRTSIRAVYPLVLESERPIHPKPVAAEEYESSDFPLYRRARAEGVPV